MLIHYRSRLIWNGQGRSVGGGGGCRRQSNRRDAPDTERAHAVEGSMKGGRKEAYAKEWRREKLDAKTEA